MTTPPTLHLLCGRIAAGKSTLAAKLARQPGTVLVAEDAWVQALYTDALKTPRDYMRCSAKLRSVVAPHVVQLLGTGVSVMLDFQANTVESRRWMRGIIDQSGAAHQLHVLAPSDAVCLARLRERNASGQHAFQVSEEQFIEVSRHFVAPTPSEEFNLVTHRDAV